MWEKTLVNHQFIHQRLWDESFVEERWIWFNVAKINSVEEFNRKWGDKEYPISRVTLEGGDLYDVHGSIMGVLRKLAKETVT